MAIDSPNTNINIPGKYDLDGIELYGLDGQTIKAIDELTDEEIDKMFDDYFEEGEESGNSI